MNLLKSDYTGIINIGDIINVFPNPSGEMRLNIFSLVSVEGDYYYYQLIDILDGRRFSHIPLKTAGFCPITDQMLSDYLCSYLFEPFIYKFQEEEKKYFPIEEEEETTPFIEHGIYTVSNSFGYIIELSDDGDSARVKDGDKISKWFEIVHISSPENGDHVNSIIDPHTGDGKPHYNIPLNQVMRVNF